MTLCDAYHDGHDCARPGACGRAMLAMLERSRQREAESPRAPISGRKPGEQEIYQQD